MSSSTMENTREEWIRSLSEPDRLKDLRQIAAGKCSRLGLPDRDTESWRKVNLGSVDLTVYSPHLSRTDLSVESTDHKNVGILPLAEALENPELKDRIQNVLEGYIKRNEKDIFRMVSLSESTRGVVVHVRGVCEKPVRITHSLLEGNSLAHFVIVLAEPDTECKILEEHRGLDSENMVLMVPSTEIECGQNSHIKHISLRYYFDSELHFHAIHSDQKENSTLHSSLVQIGGFLGKGFYNSEIEEPNAEFQAIGVTSLSGAEFADIEMHVNHLADNTRSNIRLRTVLKDRSHHVFNGNLHIVPGRKNIDALQVNNNIILNRKARAESMPNLVTRSESVSCEHGATVGQLDEEAIFFLVARGLPESEARNLLIQGFLDSIIQEIPLDEENLEAIRTKVKEKVSL